MKYTSPLTPGRLLKRYKRFLADVELADGTQTTVLCPNTGTMLGLTEPGSRIWLSHSESATRKYAWTWELIEVDDSSGPTLVGINSQMPNALVAEAIDAGSIAELKGYGSRRREVRYGENSRIDFLLESGRDGRSCYVEVKNVHLMRKPGLAEFPDSRTARGAKHLAELAKMVRAGHRAVMVYLVQRADAQRFAISADLDPAYGAAYQAAQAAGVEMLCYRCALTPHGTDVVGRVPLARPRLAKI